MGITNLDNSMHHGALVPHREALFFVFSSTQLSEVFTGLGATSMMHAQQRHLVQLMSKKVHAGLLENVGGPALSRLALSCNILWHSASPNISEQLHLETPTQATSYCDVYACAGQQHGWVGHACARELENKQAMQ